MERIIELYAEREYELFGVLGRQRQDRKDILEAAHGVLSAESAYYGGAYQDKDYGRGQVRRSSFDGLD